MLSAFLVLAFLVIRHASAFGHTEFLGVMSRLRQAQDRALQASTDAAWFDADEDDEYFADTKHNDLAEDLSQAFADFDPKAGILGLLDTPRAMNNSGAEALLNTNTQVSW